MKTLIPVARSCSGRRIHVVGMPVNLKGLNDLCSFLTKQCGEQFRPSTFVEDNFGDMRNLAVYLRTVRMFTEDIAIFHAETAQDVHAMN